MSRRSLHRLPGGAFTSSKTDPSLAQGCPGASRGGSQIGAFFPIKFLKCHPLFSIVVEPHRAAVQSGAHWGLSLPWAP